ncbi:hypothetical protein B0J13DRAFT_567820 [Dactylonectria estremocensis]|uniref:Uncharacterized protein n=1 Tax=Dactylonectria estremocensis TaxID=1079267 RepID=A0A9P9IIA9_9HYPO|nr:hypothetical protein B0J13DRAFT_567820 [Dactylonectria estremocensis]
MSGQDEVSSNDSTSAQPPSRDIESIQSATTTAPQFPTSFNLYRDGLTKSNYFIAPEQKQPLYLFVSNKWHSPEMVLHSGPETSSDTIATASWGEADGFLVAQLLSAPGTGGAAISETVKNFRDSSMTHAYRFSIEVEPTNTRETFAWRLSRGNAVKSLGGEPEGWELVHISQDRLRSFDNESLYTITDFNTDNEGYEVVAIWTLAKGSLTKVAKFQFMGSGSTGKLGQRWTVMAVITFCALVNQKKRGLSGSVFVV